MPGPVPKRSSQRRRRNYVLTDRVEVAGGPVPVPDLGLDHVHPLARDLYDSLRESGQCRWYEPSDWQRARIMVHLLSGLLSADRPSVTMYQALQKDMDALLVTEAERRRARVEIERNLTDEDEKAAMASVMTEMRARRDRLTTA